ncbi:barwin-like endoglucanase [Stereum hirsutum FP-91666 SS1]|uniref:barwin-like endoglucanase n=1 Tax=Stereum hirsutum (strain FP-91666) TaxID=721885 RepID=UPI000440BABE|nr:barwin-like endoglucanase [Stereum hirsutum FP-91666 SS1]EIM86528.1 barwin-like endoglucanase [Stereum hirsutum FP-91666 SS1]
MFQTGAVFNLSIVLVILASCVSGLIIPPHHRTLTKKDDVNGGGYGTYYLQNGTPGSCGAVHSDSDFIVAVDKDRYDPSLCGLSIQITNTVNQKTVGATIADDCPTCESYNSLDMSVAAFDAIADERTGKVNIEWKFV